MPQRVARGGAELRAARARPLLSFKAALGAVPVRVSALRQRPAEPLAHAAAHDSLEVFTFEPGQVVREEVDAFVIRARHPREVGAPERAVRTERIDEALDRIVQIAE